MIRRRSYLMLTVLLSVIGFAPDAKAGIIHTLIGDPEFGITPLSGALAINQAESHSGVLHIVGQSGGRAAAQQVTLGANPTVGDLRIYESLYSQGTPGSNTGGYLAGVGSWNGEFSYIGQSRSPNAGSGLSESSTWNPNTGVVAGLGILSTDFRDSYATSHANGHIFGQDGGLASVIRPDGSISHLPLPGPNNISSVNSASYDGSILVGAYAGGFHAWRRDVSGNYQSIPSSGFQLSPTMSLEGSQGLMAFSDPILGDIAISQYFDYGVFGQGVGVWDLNTGELLADYGVGSEFADAGMFGGHFVLAINNADGGFLSALSDGSRLSLSELLHSASSYDSLTFVQGGLYQGSLGLVVSGNGPNGNEFFTTAYHLNSTAVPEPGTLLLSLVGLGSGMFISRRNRRA